MKADASGPQDEQLAALLEACDNALKAGTTPPASGADAAPAALQPRLEAGLACLRILNLLRPQHRSTLSPGASAVLFGTADAGPFLSDSRVGSRLGKYLLTERLGQGGMGVVYEAVDTVLQRKVAIKLLSESMASQPQALNRFLLEARSAASLNHPNVVTVHEVDQCAGVTYIVMELVPGGSGEDRLRTKGPSDWPEATRMIADACRGLAAAHAAGLIHRDIKPANMMYSQSGTVKLADFGLAKPTERSADLTAPGIIVGTPSYMSPEQCRCQRVDERGDVYSLGATYYALLVGTPPFQEEATVEILLAHCSSPVPNPRDANLKVPEACAAIVRRAMAKEPSERFASAAEMLAAIEAVLAGETRPAGTTNSSALTRPATGTLAKENAAIDTAKLSAARARHSVAAWLWSGATHPFLVAAGFMATLVIAYYVWSGSFGPSAQMRWVLPTAGPVWAVAVSRDGQLIAAANGADGIRLWDYADDGPKVRADLWPGEKMRALAFAADSKLLAAASAQGLRFWHADAGRLPTLAGVDEGGEPRAIAFSQGGRKFAAASQRADRVTVKVWDLNGDGQAVMPLWDLQGHRPNFAALAISGDGKLLATGSDTLVKVWNLDTGELLKDFALQSPVRCLAFSDNHSTLEAATTTSSHTWDWFEWQESTWPSPGINSIATAGKLTASAFYNDIMINPSVGRNLFYREHQDEVYCIAFSADGRLLASGSADQTVRLWDTSSLQK